MTTFHLVRLNKFLIMKSLKVTVPTWVCFKYFQLKNG